MKKHSKLICILLSICFLMNGNGMLIKAAGLYSFEEIKTAYQEKDAGYKRLILSLQQQLLKYSMAEESLAEGIRNDLDQNQIGELELQKDLMLFYENNEQLLKNQINCYSEYQLKKQLLQLKVLKENQKYYGTYGDYLDVIYKIEEVKYKRSRSSKAEIDDISAQIAKNYADLESVISDYQEGREEIDLGMGVDQNNIIIDNYIIRLSLDVLPVQNTITANQLILKIKANNGDYIQLQNTVASYEKYINHFLTDSGSIFYRQGMLQLSDFQLQLLQLEKDITSYAKRVAAGYKKILKKHSASALSLAMLSKKSINSKKQYEKGRTTLLVYYEARVKEETERQNYYNLCYQLILWNEVLEKGIYDNAIWD